MSFRKKHMALCSKCRSVGDVSETGTFIDPFFLPKMCASCGESMQGRWPNKDRPHWVHVVIKEQWIDPVRTKNPLTWLRMGRWSEVERNEWAA